MRLAAVIAIVSAAGAVRGAPVSLSLARPVEAQHATLVFTRIDDAGFRTRRVDADLTKPLPAVDVEPGPWSVAVESDAAWHGPQYVIVERESSLVLDVWPRATVTGTFGAARKQPSEVSARFEPAGDGPSGEATCSVDGKAFRCALPAVALDLRVHARGFISNNFAHLRLEPGAMLDLGALPLREGQSITGRVEVPKGFDVTETSIRAEPAETGQLALRDSAARLLPVVTRATRRGTFQLDGVTPGAWTIRATHPRNLWAGPVTIDVIAGADARLARPFVLDHRHEVAITIDPPRTPDGERWTIELMRRVTAQHLMPATQSAALAGGTWSSGPLVPGSYHLEVRTAKGDVWYGHDLELGSQDEILPIHLQSRAVKGRVTLAGNPLAATLTFSSSATASTTTDESGKFTLTLPSAAEAKWNVQITNDDLLIDRTFENVELADPDDVAFDLPDTVLRGAVVDEDGAPAPHALIRVATLPSWQGLAADAGGTFVIHALPPGRHELQASGDERAESDLVAVDIPESGDPPAVELVVRKQKALRGFVVSDFGPVAGASVYAWPTDTRMAYASIELTDANGQFVVWLPRAAREFDIFVAAPGFAYSMDHAEYRDSVARARVAQNGGELTIRGAGAVRVMHNGAVQPLAAVAVQGGGTVSENGTFLPSMEPGLYAACANERCVSGILPPNGTLVLDVTAPK